MAKGEDEESLFVEGTFHDAVERKIHAEGEDFDASANATLFTLVRAANLLTNDLDSTVWRSFGLSYAGFRVIFAVWAIGPLEPRAIARFASVSRASVSSVINTLERDGYVVRERTSADRRLVTVRLTEAGHDLWERSFGPHNQRETAWLSAFTKTERETLVKLLRKLIHERPRS